VRCKLAEYFSNMSKKYGRKLPEMGFLKNKYEGRYTIGEDEQQDLWSQLLRVLSTQREASLNTAREGLARGDASEATQRATMQGVNYDASLAQGQAGLNLEQFINEYNRQGMYQADQMKQKDRMINLQKESMDNSFWDQLTQLLVPVGQGLGYSYGNKLF